MRAFTVVSVNISDRKGVVKQPVERIFLQRKIGIEGDAHSGDWHRQVSLLAAEDIDYMNRSGADAGFGDFAENITTRGVSLHELPVGSQLKIGTALLQITQIGKECHKGCAIMEKVGSCIMPTRGIFATVIEEGEVQRDSIGYYDL